MDIEELQHLEALYQAHTKRLKVLEVKSALQGYNTPAEVVIEIEELRETLCTLESQITAIKETIPGLYATPAMMNGGVMNPSSTTTKKVQIVLQGDFDNLTPAVQEAFVRAIAAITEIGPDQVSILRALEGSIIFDLELPEDAAKRLLHLYQSGDPLLQELGVETITELRIPTPSPILQPTISVGLLATELGYFRTAHSIPPLPQTQSELKTMRLNELIQRSSSQTPDTAIIHELFRRALVDRNEIAWGELVRRYETLVEMWIHRSKKLLSRNENINQLVTATFTRLWWTIDPDRFDSFPTLDTIVRFLEICTQTTIIEATHRQAASKEERSSYSEFWAYIDNKLQDEAERVVIHASFKLGMKPKDISEQYPNLFQSIKDVYKVKRNVLQRLGSDRELKEKFGLL